MSSNEVATDPYADQREEDDIEAQDREEVDERDDQVVDDGPEDVDVEVEENPPPQNRAGGHDDEDNEARVDDENDELDPEVDEQDEKGNYDESRAETDDDDGEDNPVEDEKEEKAAQLVNKGDKDGLDEEKERRRRALIFVGIIFGFIALLLILGLVFRRDVGDLLSRQQLNDTDVVDDEEETITPTVFVAPTFSPTPADGPIPPPPTPSPVGTNAPTSFTTIPPLEQSELPCDQIRTEKNVTDLNFGLNNFKLYGFPAENSQIQLCGDTYGGHDEQRPNRNHWAVRFGRRDCRKLNWQEGHDLCHMIGARRCSLDELREGVAAGTGCGGDRELVFTGSACQTSQGPGAYMFNVGLNTTREGYTLCETNLEKLSIVRCCGDNF